MRSATISTLVPKPETEQEECRVIPGDSHHHHNSFASTYKYSYVYFHIIISSSFVSASILGFHIQNR
ncbi:hypothetical protein QVD17_02439 [Tagetes erecta]|uniref:Uncharacterized protein n=1 Tax=Tagetes erecta TaxID=13708 RepID=A0AAD8L870_TARER|nr:hypothetical protein QVD17_02439 [Tagetes erecta]